MFSSLRTLALVGAAAATAATLSTATASATSPSGLTLAPTFGRIGSTLDIHRDTAFTQPVTVAVGKSQPVAAKPSSDGTDVTITVPSDATTGHVIVTEGVAPTQQTSKGPIFTVQQLTAATLTVAHHKLTYPDRATVTAHVTANNKPVKGQRGQIQRRPTGATAWHHVKGATVHTTGHRGLVSWKVGPAKTTEYRVVFASRHSYAGTTAAYRHVYVRPRLSVDFPGTVATKTPSSITGTIRPKLVGRINLQRRDSKGNWHTVDHAGGKTGSYSFPLHLSTVGTYHYRVVRPHDRSHVAARTRSHAIDVVARTLRYGDTGADVRRLQKRLRALHYDVGPKTSTYGWDLLHAVTAFQKVNKLDKDGQAGPGVWNALGHPKRPHLHYPDSGSTAVEVNIGKQILIIAKNGHIWRILDTSTAGGYYYTNSQGQQERAVTPRGHFAIRYKTDGEVHSKLGYLYRPSYFNYDGYAIHGEGNSNSGGNVPPYAASHGCVRITDLAVDRYYDTFAVGVSVWIY